MKLSKNNKNLIVEEFKYIAEKLRSENNPLTNMYFYSASYGVVSRILNVEYDSSLVFLYQTLLNSYTLINQQINRIIAGEEKVMRMPEDIFYKLAEILESLTERIEKDEEFYSILEKLSQIMFIASGNGYYLYQKGIIKL